jgi:hypothetical protein
MKCVTVTNELGLHVGTEIYHSVSTDLVVDNDGMPLDDACLAIQIAESLVKKDVPCEWVFSMRA